MTFSFNSVSKDDVREAMFINKPNSLEQRDHLYFTKKMQFSPMPFSTLNALNAVVYILTPQNRRDTDEI